MDVLATPSPFLAIDRNRVTVVDRIVAQWGVELAASPAGISAPQLREMLLSSRADQLLAASLAGSLDGLRNVLIGAIESKGSWTIAAKALGDPGRDLVYVPVTPCRLVDTRATYPAVYQAAGPFSPGQVRTYTVQGGNGVCLSQLPPDLHPGAVQIQVYGIPTTSASGDIEVLPEGGVFGSTATLVFLGNNAFTSAATTAPINVGNSQISVQVRGGSANLAMDIVGYFIAAQFSRIALPDSSGPEIGTLTKPGGVFLHNGGAGGNTYLGVSAGSFSPNASANTGVGEAALRSDNSSGGNTAVGHYAMSQNLSGGLNTAIGLSSMGTNQFGDLNTAVGAGSLLRNTDGDANVAMGASALHNNFSGSGNVSIGTAALTSNITGSRNTAMGAFSLQQHPSGDSNVAIGEGTLVQLTSGSYNMAIGRYAGYFLVTGSQNVYLGSMGRTAESDTVRIGDGQSRAFLAGVRGVTTGVNDAVPVVIDANGQLGTLNSSRETKHDIADMSDASSALMHLRPVTFHYNADGDPRGQRLQYGLIAEEVADVYPGMVATRDGKPETVMYQYLPPMLLNEYQKQQRTIEVQGREIAELKRAVQALLERR